ncbi:hypothetical protein Godav_000225, partial [Gossypium davidsonii]|nr:hypothetical protein [Gossypium davidsonii]
MARGTAPRVQLVRCPKCRLLLPEVEDVPVYKCGGCDTILAAKNRKGIVENMSFLQETPAAGSDILVQESEDGESHSSSPQEVHLSREIGSRCGKIDENLSIEGHYNDQNKSGDTNYKREKLDENGSNEGLQNGSRRLQLEPSEHCKVSIEAEENNKTLRLKAGEVTSSDNFFSSPNEHMGQPWRSEHRGFDHVSFIDSLGTLDYFSPSSELSDPDLESTATRTSHAYDGSMSSYDGKDDQFLVPEETLKRDKMLANGLMTCNARNRSLNLSAKKRYGTTKSSKWHRDEALEPAMHPRLPRNQTKRVRDEYRSQIPFSQRAYENAGPSHDEFYEYREHENMKLLRMVHELQDQISKTCNLNGRISRRRASIDIPCRQKHFPTYSYPEEENFYPRAWPRSE